jgi:Domain of unknown function (DUF4129)
MRARNPRTRTTAQAVLLSAAALSLAASAGGAGAERPTAGAAEPPRAGPDASAGARPPSSASDLYVRKLAEILARREFRAARRQAGSGLEIKEPHLPPFWRWLRDTVGRMLDAFLDWLANLWSRNAPPAEGGKRSLSAAAARALALGAVVLGAVLFWRLRRRKEATGEVPVAISGGTAEALPDALSQSPETWARFAEQFARDGEWRLALRALYLELLALLHARGALRYERQRTNGEYAADLARSPVADPFVKLTSAFDRAWYGNKHFDAAGYRSALQWTRAVDRGTTGSSADGSLRRT